MKWEFHAAYDVLKADDMTQIMRDQALNPYNRTKLLTSALSTPSKDLARSHYQRLVQSGEFQSQDIIPSDENLMELLGLNGFSVPLIEMLPKYSCFISFKFRLSKSYLSRDEVSFYIIDNPVRKDKVFKCPMVASSQWKGGMQSAAVQNLLNLANNSEMLDDESFAEKRYRLALIFGNEKGCEVEDVKGETNFWNKQRIGAKILFEQKIKKHFIVNNSSNTLPNHMGRLRFYPAFFSRIGLEVINPHDRSRNVGINPICFECVPAGSESSFSLLYTPLDLIGRRESEICTHLAEDLCVIAKSLKDMFTLYGFGAKTSSGFGVAEESFPGQGQLIINGKSPKKLIKSKTIKEPVEPEIVHKFRLSFPDEDFSEKPKAWKENNGESSTMMKRYKKVKQAYREHEEAMRTYEKSSAEVAKETSISNRSTTLLSFDGFTDLIEKVTNLVKCWR